VKYIDYSDFLTCVKGSTIVKVANSTQRITTNCANLRTLRSGVEGLGKQMANLVPQPLDLLGFLILPKWNFMDSFGLLTS